MKLLVINREPLGILVDAFQLCRHAVANHQVAYLSFAGSGSNELGSVCASPKGLELRTVSTAGSLGIRFLRWVHACLTECVRGYDVVYVYYFPGCSLLRMARPWCAMVLDIRSGSVLSNPFGRYLQNRLIGFEALAFDCVSVVSEQLGRMLRLAKPRPHVIPLGAEPPDVAPKTFESLHLLYVGSLALSRRLEDTIEGFSRFYKSHSHAVRIRYTIVGEGPGGARERLCRIRDACGLQDVIDLPGYVPHDRLGPFFERSNVGVSYIPITPYYDHQPPTKTFEYLAAGMIVIATATAENRKVIAPFSGILIADSADSFYRALCELAAGARQFDSAQIKESAAHSSWTRIMTENALPFVERALLESQAHARNGHSHE